MKKLLIPAMTLAALLSAGCSAKENNAKDSGQSEAESPAEKAADQEPRVDINIPFETTKLEKEKGENELEIDYPTSGEPELLESVRTWLNEQLGDTYRGNLENPEDFFRHYSSFVGEDPELNEYGGYAKDDFEVGYTDNLVVTYNYTSYVYEGGAHGSGGTYGTTFLRSDGRIFTRDCITSTNALKPMLIEGLKQYFKVSTDAELEECLNEETTLKNLSVPGMQPWIDKDGVVFAYTQYEIAPYSSGSPRFAIPYNKIEPYLTEEGKRFFVPAEE